MASIIPGYEYDIFISYRQKDNKHDGWVTEFVNNLKGELEATFKEDVSVYFDINLHDGLLETHDVDASLKEKLKCLVFIPIISRTYCDPKSFAWENEFKTFVETASLDQFGLKIKLPNGNVNSRVLPVLIHDLDKNDTELCESILGGVLRGVEFIYKEPGVNRPLNAHDDEKINLNKTRYLNQINKVSLAIKEIISGLQIKPKEQGIGQNEAVTRTDSPVRQEKSIIVLPFENMSPDPDQDYFCDGMTEEIITDLSHIHELLVISRSSAMTFKGTKKTIPEIAQAVRTRYVLEGSVRKVGNNLKITAQLIDSISDAHIWAEKYTGTLDDVFDIQENVSEAIVTQLKMKLAPNEERLMTLHPISSGLAYDAYLRARQEIARWTEPSLDRALQHLEKALEIVGDNSALLAGLALVHLTYATGAFHPFKDTLEKAKSYAMRALDIDSEMSPAYTVLGIIAYMGGDMRQAFALTKRSVSINPEDPDAVLWLVHAGISVGRCSDCRLIVEQVLRSDPLNSLSHVASAVLEFYDGRFEAAVEAGRTGYELDPHGIFSQGWYCMPLLWIGRFDEARTILDKWNKEMPGHPWLEFTLMILHSLQGDKTESRTLIQKTLNENFHNIWNDTVGIWAYADAYLLNGEIDEALRWLKHGLDIGCFNYPFLSRLDPHLVSIRSDPRFQKLMVRMKYEWEHFEF